MKNTQAKRDLIRHQDYRLRVLLNSVQTRIVTLESAQKSLKDIMQKRAAAEQLKVSARADESLLASLEHYTASYKDMLSQVKAAVKDYDFLVSQVMKSIAKSPAKATRAK